MKRLLIAFLLAAVVIGATTGCHTSSGNREYVPGKGWILTD